jgi:hypothetical protein
MYSDYGQMQQYDQHLQEKASEFRGAQVDALWLRQWLGRGLHQLGRSLVRWGQSRQSRGLKQRDIAQATSATGPQQ